MDKEMTTPPELPEISYGNKILKIFGLGIALVLAAFIVWLLSSDRQSSQAEVENQIAAQWGGEQRITGPYVITDNQNRILPTDFSAKANVTTEKLHRGIFEVIVYRAAVDLSATFTRESFAANMPKPAAGATPGTPATGSTAQLTVVVEPSQLATLEPFTLNGKKYKWKVNEHSLTADIPISPAMPAVSQFSAKLTLKGSKGLYIAQLGENCTVTIAGQTPNPSFQGPSLPDTRTVDDEKFTAKWESHNQGLAIPDTNPEENGVTFNKSKTHVGAEFLTGVDTYQKVNRAIKYAFMIIFLTFAGAFAVEITSKRRLSIMFYTLVGVALVIFYTLLLSIAEVIGFDFGYLTAAAMTVILVTMFISAILKSKKIAMMMCMMLCFLYGFCFVMLSLETYALLMGSLLLFVILALAMYLYYRSYSRKTE